MGDPGGTGGTGYHARGPMYDGRQGVPYTLWKANLRSYMTTTMRKVLDPSTADWQFEMVRSHIEPGTGAWLDVDKKAEDLIKVHTTTAAGAITTDWPAALAALHAWMEGKYGKPDSQLVHEFLTCRRGNETMEQWGSLITGQFRLLSEHSLMTVPQALAVYTSGLSGPDRKSVV